MKLLRFETWIFFSFSFTLKIIFAFDCTLPDGCFIHSLTYKPNEISFEKNRYDDPLEAIKCYPDYSFKFRFVENDFMMKINKSKKLCQLSFKDKHYYQTIKFQWPRSNKKQITLDNNFNISNLIRYLDYFNGDSAIHFINLKGIELNLSENNKSLIKKNKTKFLTILCFACKMNFYSNGKLIKSCGDILESNSAVMSLFQIRVIAGKRISLVNNEYQIDLCPLVFKNAEIQIMVLEGLVDSFYKRNSLKFTSEVFNDLNSTINDLHLNKVENIKLDLKILHPSVFTKLRRVYVYGPIKSIDKNLFAMLPYLSNFYFPSMYFRKMIHENGIDWIKEMNKNQTKIDIKNLNYVYKIDKLFNHLRLNNMSKNYTK